MASTHAAEHGHGSHGAGHADAAAHGGGDDHGGHGHGGHGHTIIPLRTLVTVLVILLVFTGLTVAVANLEQVVAQAFGITLPAWVNVIVALSIAAVKSLIVAAYFMQLRYDNPINTLIAVFSILVLTFFLGFTMVDLGSRKTLYAYKGEQIIQGGIGGVALAGGVEAPGGKSIAQFARERADAQIDEKLKANEVLPKVLGQRLAHRVDELHAAHKPVPEAYTAYLAKHPEILASMTGHGGGHGGQHAASNSADTARPKSGITLPELLPAGGADPHGHSDPGAHGESKGGAKPGH